MKVNHILKQKGPNIYSITPDRLLTEAVALMMQNRIGALVVLDEGRLVSIVTERDVMGAVDKYVANLAEVRVRDVMAPKLITCDAQDTLDHVMNVMMSNSLGHRVRHLPVMREGEFVGLLSIVDIVQALLTETQFENNLLKNYIKNWPESEEA